MGCERGEPPLRVGSCRTASAVAPAERRVCSPQRAAALNALCCLPPGGSLRGSLPSAALASFTLGAVADWTARYGFSSPSAAASAAPGQPGWRLGTERAPIFAPETKVGLGGFHPRDEGHHLWWASRRAGRPWGGGVGTPAQETEYVALSGTRSGPATSRWAALGWHGAARPQRPQRPRRRDGTLRRCQGLAGMAEAWHWHGRGMAKARPVESRRGDQWAPRGTCCWRRCPRGAAGRVSGYRCPPADGERV